MGCGVAAGDGGGGLGDGGSGILASLGSPLSAAAIGLAWLAVVGAMRTCRQPHRPRRRNETLRWWAEQRCHGGGIMARGA